VSHHPPSRIATWLLERVLPERDRDALVGDLIEEYELRAQSSTPSIASRWYWGQACRCLPRMVWDSVNRWLPTLGVATGAYIAAGALEFGGTVVISKLFTPAAAVFTVVSVVVGLATLVIGGYVATWIRPGAGTVMAVIVMIVVAVLMATTSGSEPLWYGLTFLVAGPLAALAGGALCRGGRMGGVGPAV